MFPVQPVKAGRSTLVPHVADSSSALVTSSEPHVMAVCLESDHAAILKEHFEMSTEMESSSEFQAIWQEPGMKAILRPVLLASKAYHAIIQEHADFPKVRERVSKYESKKADIRIEESKVAALLKDAYSYTQVQGTLDIRQKAMIDLQRVSNALVIAMTQLKPLYKPIQKHYSTLVRDLKKKHHVPGNTFKLSGNSIRADCRNSYSLSWTQAHINVVDLQSTGEFASKMAGPLNPTQLRHAMLLVEEHSSISLYDATGPLPAHQHHDASMQLLLAAPLMRLWKGSQIWLVDIHSFFSHPELFSALMSVDQPELCFGPAPSHQIEGNSF